MTKHWTLYSIGSCAFLSVAVIGSYAAPDVMKGVWPLSSILNQRQISEQQGRFNTLNLYMPSDYSGLFTPTTNNSIYIDYFQRVLETTHRPDAASALGAALAHNEQWDQAAQTLTIAIQMNPQFFWNYYNFAIVLWRNGQNDKALQLLHYAITLNPQTTLSTIGQSKIYLDILGQTHRDPLESLKTGYDHASSLIEILKTPNAPIPSWATITVV